MEYLRPPQLQALADAIGLWHLTGGNSHGTLCLGQGDHEPGEPFRPGDFDSFIEMFFKTGLFYVSNGIVVLAVAINLVDYRLVWYGKNLVRGLKEKRDLRVNPSISLSQQMCYYHTYSGRGRLPSESGGI